MVCIAHGKLAWVVQSLRSHSRSFLLLAATVCQHTCIHTNYAPESRMYHILLLQVALSRLLCVYIHRLRRPLTLVRFEVSVWRGRLIPSVLWVFHLVLLNCVVRFIRYLTWVIVYEAESVHPTKYEINRCLNYPTGFYAITYQLRALFFSVRVKSSCSNLAAVW